MKDGTDAERQIDAIQPQLLPRGYRAFWTRLRRPIGMPMGDAVAVLHATDPFAILDAARPDGANYGISAEAVVAHLEGWESICRFEIVGASDDWLAIKFHKLPADLCAFAEDVALFCHDILDDGPGRPDTPDRAGQDLCPTLSDAFWTAHDQRWTDVKDAFGDGPVADDFLAHFRQSTLRDVQRLARRLADEKYLFLWWD